MYNKFIIASNQTMPQIQNLPEQFDLSDIPALTTRSLNISENESRFRGVTSTDSDVFDVTTTNGIDDDNVNNNRRGTLGAALDTDRSINTLMYYMYTMCSFICI